MNIAEREAAYESYATMRPNVVLQAVFLCKEESFHRWIEKRLQGCWGNYDETMAVNYLREYCHITSRSELNTNARAAELFEQLLKEFKTNCENQHVA
jgi:hypothetical protein